MNSENYFAVMNGKLPFKGCHILWQPLTVFRDPKGKSLARKSE